MTPKNRKMCFVDWPYESGLCVAEDRHYSDKDCDLLMELKESGLGHTDCQHYRANPPMERGAR